MKATSAGFATLNTLYRNKAKQDFSAVRAELDALLSQLGRSSDLVDDEQLVVFIKNVQTLHLARGRSMREEYEHPDKGRLSVFTYFSYHVSR